MIRFSAIRLLTVIATLGFTAGASTQAVAQYDPASDDWRAEANAGIDALRRGRLVVRVTGANGLPVPGAAVRIRQTRRDFPIGTAISAAAHGQYQPYREFILDHFNWAVHENAAKWYSNESTQGNVTYADADAVLDWADANGIRMRGHTIFWATEQGQPNWVPGLDDAALQAAVEGRLESAVEHFKGRFAHWDVNNEMLHGRLYADRLGDDIRDWMFERSREIDPEVTLFLNDYNVLSYTETGQYAAQVQDFLDRGVPVGGIGMQGHFGATTEVNPEQIRQRLDTMGAFGLPVWVTEFDVVRVDETERAGALEMVLRTAYGHPAVDGFMFWGFWAGAHWRGPDAALVDQDWSVNAAGRRLQALLEEWTTDVLRHTGVDGITRPRVFHGDYEIEVTGPEGTTQTATASMLPGSDTEVVAVTLAEDGVPPPDPDGPMPQPVAAIENDAFEFPWGLDVDWLGRVMVADADARAVLRCEHDGDCDSFGPDGFTPDGALHDSICQPVDVAVDLADRLFILDRCNNQVHVCEAGGDCSAFGGPGEFDSPSSLDLGPDGHVYVGDDGNGRVAVCTAAGHCEPLGQPVADPDNFQPNEIGRVRGVAVDAEGRAWIADDLGDGARAGLQGCQAGECRFMAELDEPRDVAVDRFNRLFVLGRGGGMYRCDAAARCIPLFEEGQPQITPPPVGRIAFSLDNEMLYTDSPAGTIVVFPGARPPALTVGFNDAWLDPAKGGQGLFINAFPAIGSVFAAWFTFDTETDPDATAVFGAPSQRWLTAFGPIEHNRAELDIEVTTGGVFEAAEPAPTQSPGGTLIIQTDGCERATASYRIPALGGAEGERLHAIPLSRVDGDNVELCQSIFEAD